MPMISAQMYEQAIGFVHATGNLSCSALQRHLRVGYTAARELQIRFLSDPAVRSQLPTISTFSQVRLGESTNAILFKLEYALDAPGSIGIDATDLSYVLLGARCPDQVEIHSATGEAMGANRASQALANALRRLPSSASLASAHGSVTVVTASLHSLLGKELKEITCQLNRQLPNGCHHLLGVGQDSTLAATEIHVSVMIGSSKLKVR